MIIDDVIKTVERLRPGCDMAVEDYIACLNLLEEDIYRNIISCHEGADAYKAHECEDDTLLVPDMYASLYRFYLLAQIDLANSDITRYTNNMILYNGLMNEYSAYYNRTHMPIQKGKVRWR